MTSGRDAALIALLLHELRAAAPLPMFTPLPQNSHLAALCGDFQRQPSIRSTPQQWAQKLSKSVRTFNRLFRRETGMAFCDWRQQACLMYAMTALREGVRLPKSRSVWAMSIRPPLPRCSAKRWAIRRWRLSAR
jgi:AraC-like DNA-binding protein